MIQSEAWPRDKHRTHSAFPLRNVSPGPESDVYQQTVIITVFIITSVSIYMALCIFKVLFNHFY